MKLTYAVVMDEGPNNWNAYAPDVPGCYSAGDDIDDQRRRIRSALVFHLQCLALDGEPIPWPKMTTPEEALAYEAKVGPELAAEYAAHYPDDTTDEEDGWKPPIAEMMEIEVELPEAGADPMDFGIRRNERRGRAMDSPPNLEPVSKNGI